MSDFNGDIPGFQILSRLGTGGMSHVWKALDLKNDRLVALKILNKEYSSDAAEIQRFKQEEQTLEKIHHPGIVRSYGFGYASGSWYYAMEYVDGYDFYSLIRRKQHLPESDCLLICESISSALHYAWNDYGVVHCDIKPENILINKEGVVKLADLGLCRIFRPEAASLRGSSPEFVIGTPDYISPEQIYGDVELDCRADIYSLAATLYRLASGRFLYPNMEQEDKLRSHCDENAQAKDPRIYHPELSDGFVRLLEAMLVKNREGRVKSWADVYEMCMDIERGLTFKARRSPDVSSLRIDLSI